MPRSIYAILGHPLGHTLSPAMHNAAFALLDIDAVYIPLEVPPGGLAAAIAGIRATTNIRGCNVTVPHKEDVLAHLDEIAPTARAIGAVNTIVRDGDRLIGHNTDAPGLLRSLEETSIEVEGARVVILGAGGAARAAAAAALGAKAASVTIAARNPAAAREVIDALWPLAEPTKAELTAIPLDPQTLRPHFERATLILQTTTATLDDGPDSISFAESLPLDACTGECTVVDLVYRPRLTTVLLKAREESLRILDGTGILLHQGALAFELWTHREPPLIEMRRALLGV
jgi:shikimate dehydrogenase